MTKRFIITSIALLTLTVMHLHVVAGDIPGKQPLNSRATSAFTENKGQIIDQNNKPNPSVLYLLNTPGMNVQLRRGGFSYDLYSVTESQSHRVTESQSHRVTESQSHRVTESLSDVTGHASRVTSFHRIDFDLLNSNPACKITTSGQSADYANYYTTGTPVEGVTNVRSFQTVTYKNIYPGIDLEFITDSKSGVKYNFVVQPGGKLSSIRMKITDPEITVNEAGSLLLKTSQGTIEEAIPESHYRLAGADKAVKVRFYQVSPGVYGFLPDSPIPSNATLTIDPVPDRLWGSYYGAENLDAFFAGDVDNGGFFYTAGRTSSLINIATSGSHQEIFSGLTDGFLVKFNPDGTRVWGTYYGGSDVDLIQSLDITSDLNLVVAGQTASGQNISTPGAFQELLAGNSDAFLVKFDGNGIRIWGTYYGGIMQDNGYSCACDLSGNIFLQGTTRSTEDISTPGSHQPLHGGLDDVFLVKFDATGNRLWGTYYGGECEDYTLLDRSCTTTATGDVYISGSTCSTVAIATAGSFQPVLSGTNTADGFLARFDANGVRQWGTYYGGPEDDRINGIYAATGGKILISGEAQSNSGISSPGAFQTTYGGGGSDAFLGRFSEDGTRDWVTYYGGLNDDAITFVTTTSDGNYLFGGYTKSTNAISTPGVFQPIYAGGVWDAMLVKFDPSGNRLWGTYYGGEGNDWFYAAGAINGAIYAAGATSSLTGVATAGAHQTVYGGGVWDGLVVKFTECTPPIITITGNTSVYLGSTEVYTTQPGMTGYTWTYSPGGNLVSGGTVTDNTITIQWNTLGAQWVKVNYTNSDGCSAIDPFQLDVTVLPQPCVNPSAAGTISISQQGCGSFIPAPLTSLTQPTGQTGTLEYKWQQSTTSALAGFTDIAGSNSPDYSPGLITQTTWYRRVVRVDCMTDWTGAAITEALEMTVTVPIIPTVTITASQLQVCAGTSVTFTATGLNGGTVPLYQWRVNAINIINANNAVFTYAPLNGDEVTCVFTSDLPCTANNPAISNTITITVIQPLPVSVTISATSNPVCLGTSVTFTAAPNNEGLTPIYQWKVNGGNVGTGLPTYTYIPASGDLVSCILTSSLTCVTGNPATAAPITMTVNTNLPAGVTIAATPNPFCTGSSVTLTATPINGGLSPSYQWKVNGIDAGTNSTLFTFNPASNDLVSCVMTSSETCSSENPATSLPLLLTALPAPDVTFTPCFDLVTTVNAKPIKLKGGLPVGGPYTGPGVNTATGVFTPSVAGIGTKTITYSYTNVASCSASQTQTITVQAAPVFTCGNSLIDIRDNKVYPTVQIGTQCWMQENLDFGTEISDAAHQTDNCIVEKYDSHASRVTRHAFYQWDELMRYDPTPGLQGLCPPGWHVPDESEWTTLFNFYQGNARAGYPLQDPYLNSFKALQNGVYYLNSMWSFTDFATLFWSSTMADQTRAYAHGMNTIDQSVSVYAGVKANGFSVRCLKD